MKDARLNFFGILVITAMMSARIKIVGSVTVTTALVFLLILTYCLKDVITGRLRVPGRMAFWFALFLLAMVISLYANVSGEVVRFITQVMTFYLSIFLGYLAVRDWDDVRSLLKAVQWGCAIQAFVGLGQSVVWVFQNGFTFIAALGKTLRPYGLSASPTDYVAQLTIGLYLSTLVENPRWRRAWVGFYFVLLLISMSRGGIVMVFAAMGVYLVRRRKTWFRLAAIPLVILGLAVLVTLTADSSTISRRIFDIANINFNIKRFVTYQYAWEQITATKMGFLFGRGFGTFLFFHPIDLAYYENPHDVYLYILYCTGLFGLLIFLGGIGHLILQAVNGFRRFVPESFPQKIMLAILLVHLGTWITGLVETNLFNIGQGWVLGLLFGLPLEIKGFRTAALSAMEPEPVVQDGRIPA